MAKCCVLIPYFEAGRALIKSIDSIGPASGVDVVVVDDGSLQTPAAGILADYISQLDIRLIQLPVNRGVEYALNAGLAAIVPAYDYVARLDCGDVCVDGRLARQIQYLDGHPQCWLVGGWAEVVTTSGEHLYTVRHPTEHTAIRKRMFVNSAFTHPSVMFRTEVVRILGAYPTDRPCAEDFAYFLKIARDKDHRVANIPRVLLQYELGQDSISSLRRRTQLVSRWRILLDNFEFKWIAVFGLLRTAVQLGTSRTATVRLRSSGEGRRVSG